MNPFDTTLTPQEANKALLDSRGSEWSARWATMRRTIATAIVFNCPPACGLTVEQTRSMVDVVNQTVMETVYSWMNRAEQASGKKANE